MLSNRENNRQKNKGGIVVALVVCVVVLAKSPFSHFHSTISAAAPTTQPTTQPHRSFTTYSLVQIIQGEDNCEPLAVNRTFFVK